MWLDYQPLPTGSRPMTPAEEPGRPNVWQKRITWDDKLKTNSVGVYIRRLRRAHNQHLITEASGLKINKMLEKQDHVQPGSPGQIVCLVMMLTCTCLGSGKPTRDPDAQDKQDSTGSHPALTGHPCGRPVFQLTHQGLLATGHSPGDFSTLLSRA